jgi:hypothetical protein
MRDEVLETSAYPQIAFRGAASSAAAIADGRYRLYLRGELTLHGVTQRHETEAELILFVDGLRLRGGDLLRMSGYGIRPVTAVGGTIRLKDELRFSFDIGGLPGAT